MSQLWLSIDLRISKNSVPDHKIRFQAIEGKFIINMSPSKGKVLFLVNLERFYMRQFCLF